VERVIPDGYEVVEVSPPVVITVSNELGEARYPTMKGIMTARRKPVTTWTAQDIGADASQIGRAGSRVKMLRLFIPVRVGQCEIVEGENVADSGVKLAEKLRESKLI
jgi:electron transfer flavoprotein beta subunit